VGAGHDTARTWGCELRGAPSPIEMTSALGTRFAASGVASGPDAVRDAVGEALDGLGRSASFVLTFPPATLGPEAAVEQATAAASGVPWAGMSSDGVIASGVVVPSGCAALAFDEDVDVGVGLGEGASHDPRGAARRASAAAFAGVDAEAGHPLLLLFYDADAGLQAELVAGAYEVVGPRVPIAGGGANAPVGADSRIEPAQFASGRACRDSVVAVALVTRAPLAVGIGHGCELGALPAIVTRSDGRRILALDGRPAEEVYLEAIGHPRRGLSDSEFERLAVLHPVAPLELRGRVRPRHVRGRSPGGGLRCATAIPENAAVAFGEQSPHGILSSALEASRDALAPLRGTASAALVFDCAARRSVLGIDPQAEVDVLTSALGSHRPLVGLYTRGEVARTRGASGDLNHAVVIVAFA
jgi:hypothetical protein